MKAGVRGIALVVFVAAIAIGAAAAEVTHGRLCVAGSECRAHRCGEPLAPASEVRTYSLTADDEGLLVVGVIESNATRIACGASGALLAAVNVVSRASLTDTKGHVWELPLPSRKAVVIDLPRGEYTIAFDAARHQRVVRKVVVLDQPVRMTVELQRWPVLSGRVLRRESREPAVGAIVKTASGESAVVDGAGRFALDLDPAKWPNELLVESAGRPSTSVPVAPARIGKDLGDIVLAAGGVVTVAVRRDFATNSVDVELQRLLPGRMTGGPTVAKKTVAAAETNASLTFENVEPGDYVVLLRGAAPLERLGRRVTVSDGAMQRVAIRVEPFHVLVRAEMDGQRLSSAKMRIRNSSGYWEERFTLAENGEARLELWQDGKTVLDASLASAMTMSWRETREMDAAKDDEWVVRIPSRGIEGTVADAVTGKPLANATIVLQVGTKETGLGVSTTSDDAGRFRFLPAPYGAHELKAVARGHLPGTLSYSFAEPEEKRSVTIRLDPASGVAVNVVDAKNNPVAGAQLIAYRGGSLLAHGTTDSTGTAHVPVGETEPNDVFVIPRDGSFAMARVSADSPEVVVNVADGTSRLVIRCESDAHERIPNIATAMRYNGRMLPYEVFVAIVNAQGARMSSGIDGELVFDRMPNGVYEFWPVGTPAQLKTFSSRTERTAPVRVAANGGEHVVLMTFARNE
jgi:hypothetical protein